MEKKIAKRKLDTVAKLKKMISEHNTIGIIQMESIGASTVQKLRGDLRSRGKIVAAKNTLMRRAIIDSGVAGAEDLVPHIKGPAAFLFTNRSPYSIANYLDKNKVPAPAKAGQIAPRTVVVPRLNTGFPPGTIISELNAVGLPTRIEEGTVAIPQDTQVVAEGERVSQTLASILSRLNILPFNVGLSLSVVLENGQIIEHDDLIVDFESYRDDFARAHQAAMAVALKAGILNSDTAPLVISKAKQNALALAASIGYISEETASVALGRADGNAFALLRAVVKKDKSAVPAELAALVA